MFWADSGGLVGFPSYGSSSYTIHSDFYGLKHFSGFIDPGWQRIDAVSNNPSLRISAYISPDNEQLTAVMINTSVMDIQTDLSFTGFTINTGQVYRTTSTENCILVDTYTSPGVLTVPANAVVTLALTAAAPLYGDMNGDNTVNTQDLPDFFALWLENECSITGQWDLNDDCLINLVEFAVLAENWLLP
jgi:hypothetical protein